MHIGKCDRFPPSPAARALPIASIQHPKLHTLFCKIFLPCVADDPIWLTNVFKIIAKLQKPPSRRSLLERQQAWQNPNACENSKHNGECKSTAQLSQVNKKLVLQYFLNAKRQMSFRAQSYPQSSWCSRAKNGYSVSMG